MIMSPKGSGTFSAMTNVIRHTFLVRIFEGTLRKPSISSEKQINFEDLPVNKVKPLTRLVLKPQKNYMWKP